MKRYKFDFRNGVKVSTKERLNMVTELEQELISARENFCVRRRATGNFMCIGVRHFDKDEGFVTIRIYECTGYSETEITLEDREK